ncbi:hypothetical protein [Legionella fallonii]|uniref:Uncharacterized protein n=1 Tax=Legionella fallonii LLAP-10 TaxID=1212491 RepID=A0A098G3Q4_9GAMM|nr:hypothetical protein [Legionella fallonii]CEG56115.1 conserved protein of unknown function [Legionella fallonii LLAP-10]
MRSQYDKLVYINLTQDLLTASIDTLTIHDRVAELVKIPDDCDLKSLDDPELFPQCTNLTKVYFSAHGSEESKKYVFNRRTSDAKLYHLDDVAAYVGKLLRDANFKNPNVRPRLTLVMSVCEGLGFAKGLQKKLMEHYGVFVDVIANKYVVHERYQMAPGGQQLAITHKVTSEKGDGRVHKRPHAKVLLTIDSNGKQREIDAYELKWIENVSKALHEQVASFTRWADYSKPENIDILKGITTLCRDVDTVISLYMDRDISLTANYLFALLLSCQNASADPLYKDAMNYEMLQIIVKNLISDGLKYINPHKEMSTYMQKQAQIESERKKAVSDEAMPKILLAKKAVYSGLLFEASEYGIETVLSQIDNVQREIDNLKKSI